MKAISINYKGDVGSGKRAVEVLILADTVPNPLPVNGENVDGLTAKDVFAPFSILYVVAANAAHKLYIANESGQFVAQ